MTTEGHIAALERRHQELDRQIETRCSSTQPRRPVIAALKRKKLEVKDELTKLQVRTRPERRIRHEAIAKAAAPAAGLFQSGVAGSR